MLPSISTTCRKLRKSRVDQVRLTEIRDRQSDDHTTQSVVATSGINSDSEMSSLLEDLVRTYPEVAMNGSGDAEVVELSTPFCASRTVE